MSRRRSNGEGTLARRSDGRWEARLSYVDEGGRRRRQSFYARTKTEARGKLEEARRRLEDGEPVRDASTRVAAFVGDWIGGALEASDRKRSTKDNYAVIARTHLVPAPFGDLSLDKVRPSDAERLLLDRRQSGRSSSTVRTIYTVLRAALDTAVRDGLLRRNPAAAVKRPGVEHVEAAHLGRDQVDELLEVAAGDRLLPVLVFLLGTGARRGEALALRWADVDFEAGTARIRGTLGRAGGALAVTAPKTERSRRTVPLPGWVVDELRAHRTRQAAERLRLGSAWVDRGVVFPNTVGGYWDPRAVSRSFTRLAAAAGLPAGVSLHTLRHTVATALLEAGTSMRVVQELLGHSSFVITADVYSHVGAGQERAAADELDRAFGR